MLRSCKGNVKLAWPFLETLPDLLPVIVTKPSSISPPASSPSVELVGQAHGFAPASSSVSTSTSATTLGSVLRSLDDVSVQEPSRRLGRSSAGSQLALGLGLGTRWSDCRSRRDKVDLDRTRQPVPTRRMNPGGLAPRPTSRSGRWAQPEMAQLGRRSFGSVALAVKEDQEVVIGVENPTRTSSDEHIAQSRPDNFTSNSSSTSNKSGSASSKRSRIRSDLTDLESMLDVWQPVRVAKSRNKRRSKQEPSISLNKLSYSQVGRFVSLAVELYPEMHNLPELRGKVIRRLQTLAQSVIDRNLQGARRALGLPSSQAGESSVPTRKETIKDWKLSSRMVETLMEGLMTYGLFDLAEATIYMFETNNKRNKIDLSRCLGLMVQAERWEEVARFTSGRRKSYERKDKDAEESARSMDELRGIEMQALNELGRFEEVVKLYEESDVHRSTGDERCEVSRLSEGLRAALSLRRISLAMQIRDRLWDSRWYEVYPDAYVTALSEGIRWGGSIPEVEERVFAEEMQILRGPSRRRLLDSFAKVRVDAGDKIGHILPFYGFGTDDLQMTLASLTAESRTIEWMMGSKEIAVNVGALKRLWDKHVMEKDKIDGFVPSYVLVAFVKACIRMQDRNLAQCTVEIVSNSGESGAGPPQFQLHPAVFTPLISEMAKELGTEGAERVLRTIRRADVNADEKIARAMVEALVRHYDITDPEHKGSLLGMVDALCADQTGKRKRRHFREGLSGTDQALLLDKQVLRELIDGVTPLSKVEAETRGEHAEDSPLGRYHHFLWNNDRISLMRPTDFYHAMTQFGVPVDSKRFTEVMATYLESSDARSALEAFNLAHSVGVKPGYSMWITLLWGIMRFEGLTLCKKTLNALRLEGLEPNIAAYTTVGAGLIRSGQYRQSKEFMDLAIKRLDPSIIDTIFISVAFNARCRAGYQTEAVELLRRYQADGSFRTAIDRKLRQSIKRFRAWHKKQDTTDARALVGAFDELIKSDVENADAESTRAYRELRTWLLETIRKYWLDLPVRGPIRPVARHVADKVEVEPKTAVKAAGREDQVLKLEDDNGEATL